MIDVRATIEQCSVMGTVIELLFERYAQTDHVMATNGGGFAVAFKVVDGPSQRSVTTRIPPMRFLSQRYELFPFAPLGELERRAWSDCRLDVGVCGWVETSSGRVAFWLHREGATGAWLNDARYTPTADDAQPLRRESALCRRFPALEAASLEARILFDGVGL